MTDQLVTAECAQAFIWIKNRLVTDPEITDIIGTRVYAGTAPLNAAYPFVTMQVLDANDFMGVGAWILWSDILILVRGTIQQPSVMGLAPLTKLIQKRLHAQRGQTADASIVSSVRVRPHVAPVEESDGIFYSHMGGEYRLKVRPLTP